MKDNQSLTKTKKAPLFSPENLIIQAIKSGSSVDTIERLLAMRDKLQAEHAKKQYDEAMSAFQAECPIIRKDKAAYDIEGKLLYKYAPLDDIVKQTKHLITKHGFSYITHEELKDKSVKAIVTVKHIGGHSEESPMEVRLGNKTRAMSDSQVDAAALTFAKRYAFCSAFGILTSNEDVDGKVPEAKVVSGKEKDKEQEKKRTLLDVIADVRRSTKAQVVNLMAKVPESKYSDIQKKAIIEACNERIIELQKVK